MTILSTRILVTAIAILSVVASTYSPAMAQETIDFSVTTVNQHGDVVTGSCYDLVGLDNPTCDDDADGTVVFAGVPAGTYSLAPVYPDEPQVLMNTIGVKISSENSEVTVHATDTTLPTPEEAGVTNLLLSTVDPASGASLTDVCYELVGYSNEGCDENGDGSVQFADIPFGDYTVRQTQTPDGYEAIEDYEIQVQPGPEGFRGDLNLVVPQGEFPAPEGHTNVSVVVVSSVTGQPITNPENCVSLVTTEGDSLSNNGCDDENINGQIDFLNVEAVDDMKIDLESIVLACPLTPSTRVGGSPHMRFSDSNEVVYLYVEPAAFDCSEAA